MADNLSVISTFPFSPSSLALLRAAAQADVMFIASSEELLARLGEADVLCSYTLPKNWRALAGKLRWLQATGAGIDDLRASGILDSDSGVMVTTAVGIHATTIGEYVLGSMLMFNRSWPQMVRLQDRHVWPKSANWYKLGARELGEQTLGIVGLGSIGRRIAQLGKAFGMRVLAVRRSPQAGEPDADVDQMYSMAQLREMLRLCDYVVIAVPLTPQTVQLIGEAELRAMRSHAYLVNIARGQVINEKMLIRALTEGWIGGAGLDVAVEEPLPPDSPLFTLPNVILTPHISGLSVHYDKRLAELFADNLRRYRAGLSLRNPYKPERGY